MTAAVLLTWLVQSTALTAAAGVAVRLPGCRTRAAARSAVWSVTLGLCFAVLAGHLFAPRFAPTAVAAPLSVPIAQGAAPVVVLPASSDVVATWLTSLWIAGALVAFAVLGFDIVRIVRLRRRARPLSAVEQGRLGTLAGEVLEVRGTSVCWTDALEAPAALGFGRPVIVIPSAQANRLSDEQLQHVVLHELAHVRRRDDWRTLAEHALTAAAWINPAVQLACRQAAVAREMACDEWVVRRTASPATYARCLADVAGLRARRRMGLVSAITGRPGMLRRRVEAVLAFDYRRHAGALGVVAWAAPLGLCAAAVALLQLPQIFVVGPRTADALPAVTARAMEVPDGPRAVAAAAPSIAAPPLRRARRPVATPALPSGGAIVRATAEGAGTGVARPPEAATATIIEPAAEPWPLAATPVPAAGEAGIEAAAGPARSSPVPLEPGRSWWSGPAELGSKTGAAAMTAGRTTASFFKRVGTGVPKLFAREAEPPAVRSR